MTNRDPVVGPREHLLDLLKQRVVAYAEVRLGDRRTARARQRVEELETEARDHWNAVRVLDSQIHDAADGLWLDDDPEEING